ncbi:tRNA pseudouridine32 synthase / 23S rRNA pseudouridine746 synthase [Marinagarivorans cellulosilyticus]|uniref:tRNA pseudouridine32 synthase / 23S rRNA pseudouridine746 synthase n=2 Tax=Marinagarivorans cellulosilyticus TaxID=2721545 RepID=A0AAN1WGV6_9GAMM|nr:tRNA pseudouridine32 synthase / 23S rRNA pseudouridine746 synthase [Marinagarivorans cellulosilyticus]
MGMTENHPIDTFIAPPCDGDIGILFQDEHFLLINKPSGLLSLSGKNPLNKDSVHYRLVQNFPDATLAHRLDFGTSGIMIVPLTKAVNAAFNRQFQARTITKTYTAVLHGILPNNSGTIELPIAKDPPNFPLQKICTETGKLAVSAYQVVARDSLQNTTRVIFTPLTGRTHQLRIHSREIGHSILGCDLYANQAICVMAQRLMLHATTLDFDHPITGARINAVCHCPF